MSMHIHQKSRKFLQLAFQDYYKQHGDTIDIPHNVNMREFAFETWEYVWRCVKRKETDSSGRTIEIGCGKKGVSLVNPSQCPSCGAKGITVTNWARHLGFRTGNALREELVSRAPHSVYHSAAFYKVPVARSMHEKGWQGAELVFDIDADHLDSPCTKEHDGWLCVNPDCRRTGWGEPPETGCPDCGGLDFLRRKWICDRCLDDAKRNTLRVYDEFLAKDFGIDSENIQLNYSGHRGYHIRVRDPRVFKVESAGRVDIVHMITGLGLDGSRVIVAPSGVPQVHSRAVPGWGGRIPDALIKFLQEIETFQGDYRWVAMLKKRRRHLMKGLLREPPILNKVQGLGVKTWQKIAEIAAAAYGGKIDVPVTHDIHRVIRLIGSINGKTGFIVRQLTRDSIKEFDPFEDAQAFVNGTLRVHVKGGLLEVPRFRVGNELFGPFGDENVELPMAAAMFLLCKGVADVE